MRIPRRILTATLAIVALSAAASAQQPAGSWVRGPKKSRPEFGTASETVVNVPSFAFQGNNTATDEIVQDGSFFRWFASHGSDGLVAPVFGIPSGVVIDSFSVNNCSALANDLTFILWLGDWDGSLPGGPVQLANLNTSQGCGADSLNGLNKAYDANADGPLFVNVFWNTNNFDGSDKFNGVQIGFHRVVSPAPGTATFNDVPTGHPFFQFIEALAASGITGGCGGGNYCPDSPLTRGQMAVFLSKALGLHWPN